MKYKILFIDEEESMRNTFRRHIKQTEPEICTKIDLKLRAPCLDMGFMLQEIEEGHYDAVITDQKLCEHMLGVTYTGTELYLLLKEKHPTLPCFILTSYDDDATQCIDDVNAVYVKDFNSEDETTLTSRDPMRLSHNTFMRRVCRQIDAQREKYKKITNRFQELRPKIISATASPDEEAEYMEAEQYLRKAHISDFSIPPQITLPTEKKLEELIQRAEQILQSHDASV